MRNELMLDDVKSYAASVHSSSTSILLLFDRDSSCDSEYRAAVAL